LLQLLGIPPAQHHVIHQERLYQGRYQLPHDAPPGLLAQPAQAALPQDMLQPRAARGRQAPPLQGAKDPVPNQRRAQPRPQRQPRNLTRPPSELHTAAMAASSMIRTGRTKAAAKVNPAPPGPRFPGSEAGPRAPTTPGYPIEMAS